MSWPDTHGTRLAVLAPESVRSAQKVSRCAIATSHDGTRVQDQHDPVRLNGHAQAKLGRLSITDHWVALRRGAENAGSSRDREVEGSACTSRSGFGI